MMMMMMMMMIMAKKRGLSLSRWESVEKRTGDYLRVSFTCYQR